MKEINNLIAKYKNKIEFAKMIQGGAGSNPDLDRIIMSQLNDMVAYLKSLNETIEHKSWEFCDNCPHQHSCSHNGACSRNKVQNIPSIK